MPDLFSLWKLHKIDAAIADVRAKASALDPGRAIKAQMRSLEQLLNEKAGIAKALAGELADLELKQKGIEDKRKKIDKELYGGKVVNPREVEALQKELQALRKQAQALDERILELWELVPPAKQEADKAQAALDQSAKELVEHQRRAKGAQQELEARYKKLTEERPEAAGNVPPALLSKYEAIRQKHGGIAMAKIDLKRGVCGSCGTLLPTKSVEAAKEERVVTCESCHRILYYSESLV